MPKDEFYKLYDYAEDSYFGERMLLTYIFML